MLRLLLVLLTILFSSCTTIKVADYSLDYSQRAIMGQDETEQKVVRLLHISDFHCNYYGEGQEEIVNLIKESGADLGFITGDFINSTFTEELVLERCIPVLQALRETCPFFYVSGNHEYYRGKNDDYAYLIEEYGGTVVNNRTVTYETEACTLLISGLADPYMYLEIKYRDKKHDELMYEPYSLALQQVSQEVEEILSLTPEEEGEPLSLLLAHRPEFAEEYAASGVFDIILSGHTHGGQWRFPPFINGLYSSNQGLFPKYAGGEYDLVNEDGIGSVMIISRGLSWQTTKVPRIFNSPELVVIDVTVNP